MVAATDQPKKKMGRKPKREEDKVLQAPVWLTAKERAILEEKYGSLTSAIRETALIECYKK